MKRKLMMALFILFVINLFSFEQDVKLYLKIPNKFGDYSYVSQNDAVNNGYKLQYLKLKPNRLKQDFYLFYPYYKFYSSDKFKNFYYYKKFKMYPYVFMVNTVNLYPLNSDDFLFDSQELINNATQTPVTLLQRLFLDKNFYDKNGNLIGDPQNNIFIYLIDSSHFKRLLPNGDYIKDFFICVYYNKDNLSDDTILRSLVIDGIPLPISNYKKYSLYEKNVMQKLAQEMQKAKSSENKLYEDLSAQLKKIRKKDNNLLKSQSQIEKSNIKKQEIPKKIKQTVPKQKNIVQKNELTKKETPKNVNNPKKEIKTIKRTEEKTKKKLETEKKKIVRKNKHRKQEIKKVEKKEEKPKLKPAKVKKVKENHVPKQKEQKKIVKPTFIEKKIAIINKSKKIKYPIDKEIIFSVKGTHYPKSKIYHLSSISKKTIFNLNLKSSEGLDTLKFIIPKGYSLNGFLADTIFTYVADLTKTKKIDLNLNKLNNFQIIFIDKSEIAPTPWIGIEPIIKDIKKSVKIEDNYAILYMENENIKGDFENNSEKNYEDYIWDKIYPLATSSGIRMEHLYEIANLWNKSKYHKTYIPTIHLFLSRATLKSLIAMDNWEMTKKKFKILRQKCGDCKIIIHSKIRKKDNIPLYKLGLPYRKIK